MKTIALIALLALPALAQDTFDFAQLDKLGANASEKTNITLDSNMLKLAGGILGGDKSSADLKPLVDGLKGIYIRAYEFDAEGKYNQGDLGPLRDFLKRGNWNKIVDVVEKKEVTEIWLRPLSTDRLGGVAILSAEPKEVTVVYIDGVLRMEDLAKLSGNLGIPDIKSLADVKKLAPNAAGRKQDEKKEEDER